MRLVFWVGFFFWVCLLFIMKIFFRVGLIFLLNVFLVEGSKLIILKMFCRIRESRFWFLSLLSRVGRIFFFMIDLGNDGKILFKFLRNCDFLFGVFVGKLLRNWIVDIRMLLKNLLFWNFLVVICWVGFWVMSCGRIWFDSFLGSGWDDR